MTQKEGGKESKQTLITVHHEKCRANYVWTYFHVLLPLLAKQQEDQQSCVNREAIGAK